MLNLFSRRSNRIILISIVSSFFAGADAQAELEKKNELRIGTVATLSGPTAQTRGYSVAAIAYLKMANDTGLVKKKLVPVVLDSTGDFNKAAELGKQLINNEKVDILFEAWSTFANEQIAPLANEKKIPHLFMISGARQFNDAKKYPYTVPCVPLHVHEAKVYAKYILKNIPNAKIAILYNETGFGPEFLEGLKEGLGAKAGKMIVAAESYKQGAPDISPQVIKLKDSGANVFFDVTTGKSALQALRTALILKWKHVHILTSLNNGLTNGQFQKGLGVAEVVSSTYFKMPNDPRWADDPALKEHFSFMEKYRPDFDKKDPYAVAGVLYAQMLVQVLQCAGDDVSTEKIMSCATGFKDFALPLFIPGITFSNSPDNRTGITKMQVMKFDGKKWLAFGDLIDATAVN